MVENGERASAAAHHQRAEASHHTPLRWWHGWSPLVLLPAAVLLLAPSAWPAWIVMWTLALTIYCGCKWLTWRRTPVEAAAAWRHAAYLLAWPGLDAVTFLRESSGPASLRNEWIRGTIDLFIGIILFFGIARLVFPRNAYVAAWIGMIGVALFLHFGVFQLLSCGWRRAGIQARPFMNKPLGSESLAEFWGRRWNTAFRDLTHRFLFRPLTRRLGVPAGVAVGFLFSGLVHDLVISWPAGGGWGGPTSFFAIQGVGILVERSRFGREMRLARGIRGRMFAIAVLLLPVPLLFHHPFLDRVVIPFMHSMGAL